MATMAMQSRDYYRGQPHPGEIHVHSHDGGRTWSGYRQSAWHGVVSGERYNGLTAAELADEVRDYHLAEMQP